MIDVGTTRAVLDARKRLLWDVDFAAALATVPRPRWPIVPSARLARRRCFHPQNSKSDGVPDRLIQRLMANVEDSTSPSTFSQNIQQS